MLTEEEDKKKQIEYLKQLWDDVLAEDAAIFEDIQAFQVIESKCKEVITIFSEDKMGQWPYKKIKWKQLEKYCRMQKRGLAILEKLQISL